MQKKSKIFWRIWGIIFVLSLALFAGCIIHFLRLGYNYYKTFLTVSGLTHQDAQQLFSTVLNDDLPALEHKNDYLFLILGLDSLEERADSPIMTDTIILAHLNIKANTLNLLTLPRDIFLPDMNEKINALYNQALSRGAVNPHQSVADYLSSLIGEPIDITLVVSLAQTRELVDLLGGVTVDVERDFTDYLYPRAGVDVSIERDPAVLYETVSFIRGSQVMNGDTLLKYMRSRHSVGEEGGDLARAHRQQKAIAAFVDSATSQVFDQRTLLNFVFLGRLYRFYLHNYERYLPTHFALALGWKIIANRALPAINQHQLSIAEGGEPGVLEEATPREQRLYYNGAWVWKITDPTQFIYEVRSDLGYEQN